MTENEVRKKRFSKSDIVTLKWIYEICKSQRFKVIVLIIAETISAIVTVSFAKYSKAIINAATIDKSFEKVLTFDIMSMFPTDTNDC